MDTSFTNYYKNTVVTNEGVQYVNKGIPHLEDLHVDDVLRLVETISEYRVTEKLDGSNLIFGRDNTGRFYTSRESKSGVRFYDENEYPLAAANNTFRAAHAVLEQYAFLLNKIIEPGMAFEAEVLGGRQPNAIVYGSSKIVCLRGVIGDNNEVPVAETFTALSKALHGVSCHTNTPTVQTLDGQGVVHETVNQKWEFQSLPHFNLDIDFCNNFIENSKIWLDETLTVNGNKYTNRELLNVKLNRVPRKEVPELKRMREMVEESVTSEIIAPIKDLFLETMSSAQSQLCDVFLESHEDIGIEGIVLFHPDTHEQVKVVNKDMFTNINHFNYSIRNQLSGTIPRPLHEKAQLQTLGNMFMLELMKNIAETLEQPQLSRYTAIKKELSGVKGANPKKTAENYAGANNVPHNPAEIQEIIKESRDNLKTALGEYHENWSTYSHQCNNGTMVKYTDEIHDRTLLVFAEMFETLRKMNLMVAESKNSTDLVYSIYQKQLEKIHV